MTHIPIDQSNLPRVNEVCRDFAVLEDGALAHCLQEQEIEQHYAFNVRKNKLVQKDIRIAKRLQDEEDQQSKVFSLEQQKQIEELDSEYARAVQEELRRKAQECLQREEEDKEIAKRLQQLEEEELQRKAQETLAGEQSGLPFLDNDVEEEYLFQDDTPQFANAANFVHAPRIADRDNPQFTNAANFVHAPRSTDRDNPQIANAANFVHAPRSSDRDNPLIASAANFVHAPRIADREPIPKCPEELPIRANSTRHPVGHVHFEDDVSKDSQTPDHRKELSRSDQVQPPYRNARHSAERSPCHPSGSEVTPTHQKDRVHKEVRSHREKHCRHRSSSDSDDCPEHCARDRRGHRSQWNHNRDHHHHHHHHHRSAKHHTSRISNHHLRTGEETRPSFNIDPLDWKMSELNVQGSDQLLRDEELARRLQEEEEKRLAQLKQQDQQEDFRAAQVAQDEEIAKYIQRQELRAHRRSEELDLPGDSDDDASISSFSERRSLGIKNEVPSYNQGRLDSEGLASPTECRTPERMDVSTVSDSDQSRLQTPRNIAEELDPTFRPKRDSQSELFAISSQELPALAQTQPVPVDGLYDFLDDGAEPVFIPPTKRPAEKAVRSKPKDKKEGCKQQ